MNFPLSRRNFLRMGVGAGALVALPYPVIGRAAKADYRLVAQDSLVPLAGDPFPKTSVWSYNGEVSGPLLRMRQGEPVRIVVENKLKEPTTVHWHGLRITNAMDGVPVLTQAPIEPGKQFTYEFTPPDAGTFWYHSHVNTAEQVGRGLYGPIVVEEQNAPMVDRDEVWVLDDWRLDKAAQIVRDFDNPRDLARAGRLGSTITVNGRIPTGFRVRAGERIRLRLINACNARIFALRFQGHSPWVVARDGQPVDSYQLNGNLVIGPAQRFDLVLDMTGEVGESYSVLDTFFPQSPFKLADIVYQYDKPVRDKPLEEPLYLAANPLAEPNFDDPQYEEISLSGGDLGRMTEARYGDATLDVTRLYLLGKMWALNGVVSGREYPKAPIFSVKRGRTVALTFRNHTAWPHPMHMHGHHFRVLKNPSSPQDEGKWLDTVVVRPEDDVRVAFVADNPGKWLVHCHILGHARGGMLGMIEVG